jgi:type III pantothenate kinase
MSRTNRKFTAEMSLAATGYRCFASKPTAFIAVMQRLNFGRDLTALSVRRSPCWRVYVMVRPIDYLLIDISNSFTKLAFASKATLSPSSRVATADFDAPYLRRVLKRRNIARLVVCSVVPKKNRQVRKAARGKEILWLNSRSTLGVGIDYPAPRTIGADRLANAAAVAALYGWPAIVVDFGTAVTFDIISDRKCYVGGVIAPGLEAMTNFLYQRTALLPKLSLKEPRRAVGKSTIEAMRAGAILGYRGLIREIISRIKAEQFPRSRVKVVATGGYARLIAARLPEIQAIHPDLTLEGLRVVANMSSMDRQRRLI